MYKQRVASQASIPVVDQGDSGGKEIPHSSTVASGMSETSSVCSCSVSSKGLTSSLSDPNKLQTGEDQKSASLCEDDNLKQKDTNEFKSLDDSKDTDRKGSAQENVADSVLDSSVNSNNLSKKEERTIDDSMSEVFEPCLESSQNDSGLELMLDIGPSQRNGHSVAIEQDSIYANGGEVEDGLGQIEQTEDVSAIEQNSVKTDEEMITSELSDLQIVKNSSPEVCSIEAMDVDAKKEHDECERSKPKGGCCSEDVKTGENNIAEPGVTIKDKISPQGEIRIGNIVYLPVEEDVKGQITLKGMEQTTEALLKLSSDDFKKNKRSVSESDSVFLPDNKSSSFSSFRAPPLSAFVNYATGLFRSEPGDRDNVKDIQDALADTRDRVEVENAVKLADKPELFLSFDSEYKIPVVW